MSTQRDALHAAMQTFMAVDVELDEACAKEAQASNALDAARDALKKARDKFYEAERDLSEAAQALARSGEF